MKDTAPTQHRGRTVWMFLVPGTWSLLLLVIGIVQADEGWSKPSLIVGGMCAAVVIVAALFRSWIGATWGVMLVTVLSMIASGFIAFDADPAVMGMGVIALVLVAVSLPIALLLRDMAGASGTQVAS